MQTDPNYSTPLLTAQPSKSLSHHRSSTPSPVLKATLSEKKPLFIRASSVEPSSDLEKLHHQIISLKSIFYLHIKNILKHIATFAPIFTDKTSFSSKACKAVQEICHLCIMMSIEQSAVSTTETGYNISCSGELPKALPTSALLLMNNVSQTVKENHDLIKPLSQIFFSNTFTYFTQYSTYLYSTEEPLQNIDAEESKKDPDSEESMKALGTLILTLSNLRSICSEVNMSKSCHLYQDHFFTNMDSWIADDEMHGKERKVRLQAMNAHIKEHFKTSTGQHWKAHLCGSVHVGSGDPTFQTNSIISGIYSACQDIMKHPNTDFQLAKLYMEKLTENFKKERTIRMSKLIQLHNLIQQCIGQSLFPEQSEDDLDCIPEKVLQIIHSIEKSSKPQASLILEQLDSINTTMGLCSKKVIDQNQKALNLKDPLISDLQEETETTIKSLETYFDNHKVTQHNITLPSLPHPLKKIISTMTYLLDKMLNSRQSSYFFDDTQRHTPLIILILSHIVFIALVATNLGYSFALQTLSWHALTTVSALVNVFLLVFILCSLTLCCVLYLQKKGKQRFQLQKSSKGNSPRNSTIQAIRETIVHQKKNVSEEQIPLTKINLNPEDESHRSSAFLRQLSVASGHRQGARLMSSEQFFDNVLHPTASEFLYAPTHQRLPSRNPALFNTANEPIFKEDKDGFVIDQNYHNQEEQKFENST